ncbi:hypothetical protein [Lacinutrix sp. Hel_I_90]|uniref:hypothetical protein n=1 Tax=Lacinutrix sp. Hel_I_90 TaxID=1249999 RepID=UPI0005C84E87|nr:hypothetical protein [Lacinutrix sp. Hel_I_90]
MFYFKDKFNIKQLLKNQTEDSPVLASSKNQSVITQTETHIHLGYEYPNANCTRAGIYLKSVNKSLGQNLLKIGGFHEPFHLKSNYDPYKEDIKSFDAYFNFDTDYKYIECSEHLQLDSDSKKPISGRILKEKNFFILLKGEAFNKKGESIGEKKLYVHEVFVVKSKQLRLYYKLDEEMRYYHKTPENEKQSHEMHAQKIFDIIYKEKNLKLIFNLEQTDDNIERIYVDGDFKKTPFQVPIGDVYVKKGAGFVRNTSISKEEYTQFQKQHKAMYNEELSPIFIFNQITKINYSYFEAGHLIGFPGNNNGTLIRLSDKTNKTHPYPHLHYLNELELVITHEYIHALQHCLDPVLQGGRDIGDLRTELAEKKAKEYGLKRHNYIHYRRSIRELFAHHFCIFPNRVYRNSNDDPVFKYTNFKRGIDATFGNVNEYLITFWIFRAYSYISFLNNHLDKEKDSNLKKEVVDAIKDVLEEKTCYEKKGYQFPEPTGNLQEDKTEFFNLNNLFWEDDFDK